MITKTYEQTHKVGIEQLYQLIHLTWDGDLTSKQWTRILHERGYITRENGWNIINEKGISILIDLGLINP